LSRDISLQAKSEAVILQPGWSVGHFLRDTEIPPKVSLRRDSGGRGKPDALATTRFVLIVRETRCNLSSDSMAIIHVSEELRNKTRDVFYTNKTINSRSIPQAA